MNYMYSIGILEKIQMCVNKSYIRKRLKKQIKTMEHWKYSYYYNQIFTNESNFDFK